MIKVTELKSLIGTDGGLTWTFSVFKQGVSRIFIQPVVSLD